jgi:uncharacterized protein (TIGR02646 family)
MKYIQKTESEPAVFTKWKKAGGWDASDPDNHKFDPKAWALKQEIKELLLKEQGFICCYCEEQITTKKSHIEHLLPKGISQFSHLKSDYSNLLCSCDYLKSCGHYRDKSIIKVSPLQGTCENAFVYDDNGKIDGTNQDAIDTIRDLKLDCERLNAARNGIIIEFLNVVSIDITLSEYDDWVEDYLAKYKEEADSEYRFRQFWSAVKFIAKKYRPFVE